MTIERSKGGLLSASVMAVILILATSDASGSSTPIATISQENNDVLDSNSCMLAALTNTWVALPMEDAGVSRGFPDNKRGVEEPWHMWVSSCSGVPYAGYFLSERSFLKFDLSTIPSLEDLSVRLFVYCYKTDGAPMEMCSVAALVMTIGARAR